MNTTQSTGSQAFGIRMFVGERDYGWVEQDHKPLLFSDKAEAQAHANELNARTRDASYIVAPWPAGVEGGR